MPWNEKKSHLPQEVNMGKCIAVCGVEYFKLK